MSRLFDPTGEGSSYDFNPQSSPLRCGLEVFAELSSEYAGSYEFDYLCVWIDTATSNLLAARDSGCSCPTPFEDYRGTGQMVEVRSWDDIQGLIGSDGGGFDSAERYQLRRRVDEYLAGMALATEAVEEFTANQRASELEAWQAQCADMEGVANRSLTREAYLLEQIVDLELAVANSRQLLDECLTVIREQGEMIQAIRLAVRV